MDDADDVNILSPTSHLFRDLHLPLLSIKTLFAFDLHNVATITGIDSHRPSNSIANDHSASCTCLRIRTKFIEIRGTGLNYGNW